MAGQPLEFHGFAAPIVIGRSLLTRDHPQGLNRIHSGWILQLSLTGKALVDPGPDQFEVQPQDALLYAPGVPMHIVQLEDWQWEHRWIALKSVGVFGSLLNWPERPGGARRLRIQDADIWERVTLAIEELLNCYFRRSPVRRIDLCMNLIHKALLWMEEANPRSHPPAEDPRVLKAVGIMKQDFGKKLTVQDLASTVHLSASRFAHLFRQVTGQSPMRYLESIRLDQAQQMLLGSTATLFQIARACGFCNEFYFSNVFKNMYNIRPNEFRKQAGRHQADES